MKKAILIIFLTITSLIVNAQQDSKQELLKTLNFNADNDFDLKYYDRAYLGYCYVIEQDTTNGKAYRRAGYLRSLKGYTDKAIELINKAIAIDSTDKIAYYYLGNAYSDLADDSKTANIRAKNKNLALTYLKKALQLGYTDAQTAIDDLNKPASPAEADSTPWTKDDIKTFGSKNEKLHQDMIGNTSRNRLLSRFIGFKVFYLSNLSLYMQHYLQLSEDGLKVKQGIYTYTYSKKGAFIGYIMPKKDYVRVNVTKNERVTMVRITGSLSDLSGLFLNYWPQEADWASDSQLKPGVSAIKHCYGDLISFKWNGPTPYILISKDPNMTVPVTSGIN